MMQCRQVRPSTSSMLERGSRLTLEEQGHRAIVHQLEMHVFLEPAGFDGHRSGTKMADEGVEEARCLLRWRRLGEARAAALAGVAVEGEVRHRQQGAATFAQALVEGAFGIGEDAE